MIVVQLPQPNCVCSEVSLWCLLRMVHIQEEEEYYIQVRWRCEMCELVCALECIHIVYLPMDSFVGNRD